MVLPDIEKQDLSVPLEPDPWGTPEVVPEWDPAAADEPWSPDLHGPAVEPAVAATDDAGEPTGQADARLARLRRRSFVRAGPARLPWAAVVILGIVGATDGWRMVVPVVFAAVAVAATRLRFSGRAALGLLVIVVVLSLAGWAPGSDRSPKIMQAHPGPAHLEAHARGRKAAGK